MDPGSTKTGRFGVALYLALLLVALTSTVSGQNASAACSYTFSQQIKEYATCVALSQLNCYLHWTYNASTGIADIAFRATNVKAATAGNWVAWALNPTSDGMAGAQALVAFKNSSGLMSAYTSSVASTDTSTKLTESALSFAVAELAAESSGGTQIIIFAKIQVPQNKTSVNHVWQVGPLSGDSPEQHPQTTDHVTSKGTVDFLSGVAQAGGGASRLRNKNIHGVLNAVSWGLMMPLGFIIARYMRVFKSADPAWFYLHITCQSSAYVIGVAGWGLGLKLGHDSAGVTYHTHRYIGIALFCLATLQVLALLLRPNKDHKYRIYWNFYHHGIGYTVIILSIINVFKGLDILDPEKKWKTIYIILLIVLGCIALLLEVITWIVVIRRKRKGGPEQKYPYVAQNARSGSNGLRSQP